ncbi:MAG: DnaJ C-terminal domain-containing protein [Spirochaetota bacterium]
MAVKYQDYYESLGIDRSATQEEIQSAYRRRARKYHPDVNKSKDAEEKFKQIGEAYEVLKDPSKRAKYDQLGANWKAGQDFNPPPEWDFSFNPFNSTGGEAFHFDGFGGSGFSDFFEMLFGDAFGVFGPGKKRPSSGWALKGQDQEAELTLPLEEAYRGGKKTITLESGVSGFNGRVQKKMRSFEITIPAGITDGRRLRLAGQGLPGISGGRNGDLYLKICIAPHSLFRVKERDIEMDVPVTPWEAALGAAIEVPLVAGRASLKLPAGTQTGQRIRLKGKGLRTPDGTIGDLYAIIQIVIPKVLSRREHELFEELARISEFRPRQQ